ncbi:MAG: recombinase family protein [Planctomycetota bacterium]
MKSTSPTSVSSVTIRTAIYARVSSDRQAQEQTIDSQVSALRERVTRDGHTLEDGLCFLDDGVSGSTLRRPALERLRDLAYVGGFQKLYVHSPDRLARNYAYQVVLVEELVKHGVKIEFLNRPIGVSPEEDLLLQMQGMFAEYERAKIMERCRRGKRHAASRGSVSILCNAPYGYRYIAKHDRGGEAAYEIHEQHAAVVRQLFEWVGRDRISVYEATRRLRAKAVPTPKGGATWDRSSVWKMLKNPAYQGSATYGKTCTGPRRPQVKPHRGQPLTPRRSGSVYIADPSERIVIPVPAIVSEELFATVQEQLTDNRKRSRERKSGARHLLQGLLECECCGYAYTGCHTFGNSGQSKTCYTYYRCVGTDAHRFGGKRVCENKQVRRDKLDEAIWDDACDLLRHPNLLRKEYERRLASPEASEGELSLKKQISSAQGTVNRLIDAYTDGVVSRDEFEPRVQRARKRLSELQVRMEATQSQTREQAGIREALACLDTFTETVNTRLGEADWNTRREILRNLINRVVVGRDQVRIVYRVNFPLFVKKASNGSFLQFCCRRLVAIL